MVGSMFPLSLLQNYFFFGDRYFTELPVLFVGTLVMFFVLCLGFMMCDMVAISMRNRFPEDADISKRLFFCIVLYVLITGVYLSVVVRGFDVIDFLGFEYDERAFLKSYISIVVMSIFLLYLIEGVSRFENYKNTLRETEQLKKEYMQSQLLGLKSQMNPHFLFNGLNTLSSLIQEDAERAEDFLDHMSKVYRYLLRNNEEQLVNLRTEISFIDSYCFLLKARYGEGLQVSISVARELLDRQLPPLTLQMIFEHILAVNTISRSHPLAISIDNEGEELVITNNVQPKMASGVSAEEGIDNIANKFRLLCQKDLRITEEGAQKIIYLPLIPGQEEQEQ